MTKQEAIRILIADHETATRIIDERDWSPFAKAAVQNAANAAFYLRLKGIIHGTQEPQAGSLIVGPNIGTTRVTIVKGVPK